MNEKETLKDNEIIEKLKTTINYVELKKLILSLQDEGLKAQQIYRLHDWEKSDVILEFRDEEAKIQALEHVNDEYQRLRIVVTLSDEQKIKQIEQKKIKNSELVTLALMSIQDRARLRGIFLPENRKYLKIGLKKQTTVGVEIETQGNTSFLLKKAESILSPKDIDRFYQESWLTKDDETFEIAEESGVEITSPILRDSEEDVEELYMVCSMLEKAGQKATEKCAGQIHIGAAGLKSIKAYTNLLEICGNCERILYIMSNAEGEVPREGIREWAAPLSPKISKAIEERKLNPNNETDLKRFIAEMRNAQGDRTYGINLTNLGVKRETIEFRMPNGTINPDVWIENIRLFGRIVEISQRLVEIENEQDEKSQRLLMIKERLKEEISEQEKMELLLELVLEEEEREVYRCRYLCNVELIEHLPEEKNPFRDLQFKKVDFGRPHTLGQFGEVARKSTQDRINVVMQETMSGELGKEEEKQQ